MNENSSKQVLLSVIGIAVLVVAVVGVSFAFFTYSKAGERNNTITTGSIFFDFTEGQAIYLTNQFPIPAATGKILEAATGQNATLTFSVQGYDSSTKGIAYTITAVPGTAEASKTRLRDSEVYLYLTGASAVTNNYSTPAAVGADGSLTPGVTLATGKIIATSAATPQEDEYTLRMWIPSEVVSIAGATDTTTHTYSEADFANLYYSLKVNVNANTAS